MTKLQHPSFIIILISLIVSACAQPAEDPKLIADKYWHLLQTGNINEAEKLVSIDSRRFLTDHSSRIESISQLTTGDTKATVSTEITTIDPNTNQPQNETFNTVLVLQQGQWKIDISQSQIPAAQVSQDEKLQQLTDKLSDSMQENIDSIDGAMKQGMQLFNEALKDGSKEMGDSLLHMMNNLNSTMQESIDRMKQRRQQQKQQPPESEPQQTDPDPHQGEGMI